MFPRGYPDNDGDVRAASFQMLNAGICNTLHADMDCDNQWRAQGLCSYLVLLLPDSIDKGIICQPSDCFSAIVNS